MMLRTAYCRYDLIFKEPAITSRQTMTEKETWLVRVWHAERPEIYGIGECSVFRGLSADDTPDYPSRLAQACRDLEQSCFDPAAVGSSIRFGIETAMADLLHGGVRRPFPSPWSQGHGSITINGLVWMGSAQQMCQRVEQKIAQGSRCIKFKVGGVDFADELRMISAVRDRFAPEELEIRLDANGAFTADNVDARLDALAPLMIHSIEQPVKPRQPQLMARLCRTSPIPIALDEELIGIDSPRQQAELLQELRPHYIILKPSLCGGFSGAAQWIAAAQALGIGWWVTSALESNIGLNALAQWVSTLHVSMPQGLGTGALYSNNFASPLVLDGAQLSYDPALGWNIPELPWITP